jgi:cardiolipin synthase
MRATELCYREISTRLTTQTWSREPLIATTLDGLARLTSALQ